MKIVEQKQVLKFGTSNEFNMFLEEWFYQNKKHKEFKMGGDFLPQSENAIYYKRGIEPMIFNEVFCDVHREI